MLMTEEVAASKRCTLSLVSLVAYAADMERALGATVNSPFPLTAHHCIGSQCAQWAWFDYANQDGKTWRHAGDEFTKGRLEMPNAAGVKHVPARGYCGLTGSK